METTVDARGLACPQPVINAKKALEKSETVVVIVDNRAAVENVTRMAEAAGCDVQREVKGDGTYITMRKGTATDESLHAAPVSCTMEPAAGPTVAVFSGSTMGRGDDGLGAVLVRSLLHTIAEAEPFPDVMVFFNSGVKLAVKGSEVLDDLKSLESRGVRILVCGTCLNYLNLEDSLGAGHISNMYEIKETLFAAGRLVQI
ncbi:MAG: sulfurtransferase-like selenium metabolism protein YedF [Spirochaetes bacterium]|nr:sulfurtransferase-like selenium metabolism protein YedF [Spirochaetota bacterium]